jgi:hypothetical protein
MTITRLASKGTPPPTNPADVVNQLGGVGSGSSTFGKVDLSNSTFNVLGLGIPTKYLPGGKTILTPDELNTALRQLSFTNPDIFAGIQYAMWRSNNYSTTATPDYGVYKSQDTSAIKRVLENMTVLGGANPTSLPFTAFLQSQENRATTIGGNAVRNKIAKIAIPNTQDLNTVLQHAFTSALGRPATDAEQSRFASAYQSSVFANAQGNLVDSAPAAKSAIPSIPATDPNAPAAPATIAENFAKAANTNAPVSTLTLAPQQQVADPTVAATNFALKADPAGAAENGLNDAMNSWFSTLAKGGGK